MCMVPIKLITVEVAYAMPMRQEILTVQVTEGSSIFDVINQSKIVEIFPEIDLEKQKVGVFSKLKKLTDQVKEGDRVEIYRPLLMDPKDARRAKGALKKRK